MLGPKKSSNKNSRTVHAFTRSALFPFDNRLTHGRSLRLTRVCRLLLGLFVYACARESGPDKHAHAPQMSAGGVAFGSASGAMTPARVLAPESPLVEPAALRTPAAGAFPLIAPASHEDVGVVDVPSLVPGQRYPLIIAAHQAYGNPALTCAAARQIFGGRAFVVCPRGQHAGEGVASWTGPTHLRTQMRGAVAIVCTQFVQWLDMRNSVFFGHSQGAMIAPLALAKDAPAVAAIGLDGGAAQCEPHLTAALMFEGLPPNPPSAKVFLLRTSLTRILLVSGQGGWAAGHAKLAHSLDGTPLTAKAVHLGEMGHYLTNAVNQKLAVEVGWLLAGVDNWSATGGEGRAAPSGSAK
jgi:hypothetical protein